MSLVEIIGWSATAVGALLSLPQLVRLRRTRNLDGLSLVAWRAMLVLNLSWLAHGVHIGQPPQIVTNAVALGITLPLLVMLTRSLHLSLPRVLALPLAASAAIIAIDLSLGSLAFGIVAMIPGLLFNLGQSVELVRAPLIDGVAPLFLALACLNQCLWLTWAVLVHDPGTILACALTLTMTGFNLTWFALRRLGLRALFIRAPGALPESEAAEPDLARG
ncbi:SemiSWEET family sugar transporter [Micropruina sp.]|uniref:SemiSWEET family sugar transporter n=1 Tax=Micropruina sp. TaxID=2737536 RepID=UPI0039E51D2C